MKQILALILLILSSFLANIIFSIFPDDNNKYGQFFALIIQCLICIVAIVVLFIIRKSLLQRKYFKICIFFLILTTGFCSFQVYKSFAIYSIWNFWYNDRVEVLNSYENLTINNYKNSYHLKDVIVNNAVLHKFQLQENCFYIKYLDINSLTGQRQYPLWIQNSKIICDNKDVIWQKQGNLIEFSDSTFHIKYKIGINGLNEVEDFYTGGGTEIQNGKEIRESGVIDQNGYRIIVSKNSPNLEVHSNYGKLIRFLIKVSKK